MDLNKLNNLANAKKTEAEKQKEKERLEQLKKEKEKKDTIDKIQSFFDGTYNSKVISYIKNISDEQLQEQIENLISKDYDSDKYTLDISINFNFIEFEYGENIIDEDLIDENRNIYNKEMNTKLTRKQFIQEAIYDRCINEYWYNYYDFTYDDILIKINNKNINKFNKTRNIRLIKNNTFTSQIDSERNKINLIASIEKRILSSNPSLKNNIRKIPLNLSSSNKKNSFNNSINPSFKNSLIRNALSESNFDFNLDYIKKLWRNESNERLKSDKKFSTKFSVDGKNYDYSNLMSLRHIKLKTKIAKYPAFSLTKNVIIFKKDSQFPSLLFPKSKKKKF